MKLQSLNPSKNYELIGEVEISSPQDIVNAVQLSRNALASWVGMGLNQRIKHIKKLIAAFEKKQTYLASLMSQEMGMPITQANDDITYGIEFLHWYSDHAHTYLDPEITYEDTKEIHRVIREPRGVVAAIVPWNFPFSNFVWGAGQNLICGNTVVFKHSEETPLFGKAIEDIFLSINFPTGVFIEVYGSGEVGKLLVHQDIDMICFTGSTSTGQYLYTVAAQKLIPILMELGGSAPGIVFEDADIDKILGMMYTNRFMNCGQICDGLKRLIVHEAKLQEVLAKLTKEVQRKKVGDSNDKETDIGPLVAKRQLILLEKQVKDAIRKGAKIITGGNKPTHLKGAYYTPTLLTNITRDMKVWKEEVFGPVLPIISFQTEAEAIKLANDTQYGLGGYIFTEDKEKFLRVSSQLKTGMISQNNVSYVRACNPFGGYKKSGLGREHGKFGFHELTQVKIISRER